MRITAPAAFALLLSIFGGIVRAEDPPEGDAPKAAPQWTVPRITRGLDVSRDGKWVACHAYENLLLYPTSGGGPVTLDCGKGERLESAFAFSPDSKYLCVAGEAGSVVVKGLPEDKTQSVFIFQVGAPAKPRKLELALKAEGLSADVKKFMDPKLRSMKTLSGAVREFVPLAGSRVIFDRGELGLTMWDLSNEAKFAAPPALDSSYACGISADGAKCVRLEPTAIEVRDVKTNRVLQKAARPSRSKKGISSSRPVLAPDGGAALLLRTEIDIARIEDKDATSEYVVECWSLADGKLKWEAPAGSAKYAESIECAASHAVVVLNDDLVILDLRDGAKSSHEFTGKKVRHARISASGDGLWVVEDSGTLTRIALPALEEK